MQITKSQQSFTNTNFDLLLSSNNQQTMQSIKFEDFLELLNQHLDFLPLEEDKIEFGKIKERMVDNIHLIRMLKGRPVVNLDSDEFVVYDLTRPYVSFFEID